MTGVNMTQIFTAKPYQEEGTKFLFSTLRAALFMEPGTGKTMTTLNALDLFFKIGIPGPYLIIAPKRVARSTWMDEIKRWTHTRYMHVEIMVGSPSERLAALNAEADIKTINYENLQWLADQLDGKEWPFKVVVFDESSKCKSLRCSLSTNKSGKKFIKKSSAKKPKGLRIEAIVKRLFDKEQRVYLLTGTPCSNSLADLWAQLFLIDAGASLGHSFTSFEERWFRTDYNGFTKKLFPHSEKEIRDAIAPKVFTLRAKDYLDLGEEITTNIYVDLPPKVREHYDAMEKEFFIQLRDAGKNIDIEAFTKATSLNKLRQISNGTIYHGKEGLYEVLHDAKIQALESIIEEACGMPIIVVYAFKSDLEQLKKAFPKGKALDTSKVSEDNFKQGKIPILFLHPASAAHGVDGFQYITNKIVFYSVDWDSELRSQAIARVGAVRQFQAKLNRPCFIYNIMAKDSVDADIMSKIEGKVTIEDALKDGLARRGLK
jgi:SNF2 family DNA or RNA helicase